MAVNKMKLRQGDEVVVLAGRDKGKKGEITRSIPAERKVVVAGINNVKRHQRPSATNQGGITEKSLPIDISNVALVDPKQGKATKIGYKTLKDGSKVRVAKLSGEQLSN